MESLHAIHNELDINFKAFDDKSVDAIAHKANFPYDVGLRDITIDDVFGVLENYDYSEENIAEFRAEFKTLADFNDAIRKLV
jgi:hypothetical protein